MDLGVRAGPSLVCTTALLSQAGDFPSLQTPLGGEKLDIPVRGSEILSFLMECVLVSLRTGKSQDDVLSAGWGAPGSVTAWCRCAQWAPQQQTTALCHVHHFSQFLRLQPKMATNLYRFCVPSSRFASADKHADPRANLEQRKRKGTGSGASSFGRQRAPSRADACSRPEKWMPVQCPRNR